MTTQRENLVGKVRALLAKTMEAGCTEGEALVAIEKANAMIGAYEITEAELNLTKEEKAIIRREPRGTKDPHLIKWRLCGAVARFTGCRSYREQGSKALTFCGLPSDAQFGTWLLSSLTAFVHDELFKHLLEIGHVDDRREQRQLVRDFVVGCTDRISERLIELRQQREQAAATPSNARALVVIQDQAIQAKLDELGIRLGCGGGLCGASDSPSASAGRAAGDRASFGRPVSGRNATLRISAAS
jgi:hypothetical protein